MATHPQVNSPGVGSAIRLPLSSPEGVPGGLPQVYLAEFERLKGQFLASLNHEIRTPLSGVLGMTDLLLETSLDDEQKEYVSITRECATQLLDTLNSVLAYSSLSAGSLHMELAEFPLRQLLESVASEYHLKAEAKGLEFVVHMDPELPDTAIGDARHLREILVQLLRNALKFTPRGCIEVSFRGDVNDSGQPLLRIDIRDTGIGIAPDHLERIFESFQQLESGLARSYAGIGLGLALADKLARMLGGEISVHSDTGSGSTFTVCLPLRSRPLAPAGVPAGIGKQAPRTGRAGRPKVLVVDDNKIAQQIVGHILKKAGYDFDLADDGDYGIAAARNTAYDLILMDLQMPGTNGIGAADAIRSIPAHVRTPIIALTANCSDQDRQLCLQHGMQGFLPKPIQKAELLDTLHEMISARD